MKARAFDHRNCEAFAAFAWLAVGPGDYWDGEEMRPHGARALELIDAVLDAHPMHGFAMSDAARAAWR